MKEIKAGDIMLNNWFIGYDGKPFQWKGYHFGMIENEVECVTIDEIIKSAIPLTEDILLKAGFEFDYKGFIYKEPIDGYRMKLRTGDGVFEYCLNTNYSIKIQYLHQLQNLFKSLTGTNLKVEV